MKKAELYNKLIEAEEKIVALEKENKEIKSLYNKVNELQKLYFDSYIELVDKFREANRELIEMKLQEIRYSKQELNNYN